MWLTLVGIYSHSWQGKDDSGIMKQLSTRGSVREQRQMHAGTQLTCPLYSVLELYHPQGAFQSPIVFSPGHLFCHSHGILTDTKVKQHHNPATLGPAVSPKAMCRGLCLQHSAIRGRPFGRLRWPGRRF